MFNIYSNILFQKTDIIVEMSGNILDEMRNELPVTSKLTVTISDPHLQHIKWIYYLRGIFKTYEN